MEDKICLDTDILVNFLRNEEKAVSFIEENETSKELAITYINAFELYYGAYKSNKQEQNLDAAFRLLSRLTLLNLNDDSVREAAKILVKLEKHGSIIDFRDILIGSMALVNKYSIKTNNVKHFNRIEGLQIL